MTYFAPQISEKISAEIKTIDGRGPRFSALVTTLVLILALATNSVWILIIQAAVFAIGAFRGPQFTPYAWIFKRFVRPRLRSALLSEDIRPPQFAQSVGFIFALAGILGSVSGLPLLFTIATGAALAAAFLNAAFNFCLGCEVYLLLLRLR